MVRVFTAGVLALSLLALGCNKNDDGGAGPTAGTRGGGATGGTRASTGGAGGSSSTAGSGGSSSSAGSGGSSSAGGSGGSASAGSTGAAIDASDVDGDVDAPAVDASLDAIDAAAASDASAPVSDGPLEVGGTKLPDRPWIHLCPKDYTQPQCCTYLCECLKTNCSTEKNVDSCMASCMNAADHATRCRVFQCYESLDPRVPQDHVSHCGHASGRVGGGDCPPGV